MMQNVAKIAMVSEVAVVALRMEAGNSWWNPNKNRYELLYDNSGKQTASREETTFSRVEKSQGNEEFWTCKVNPGSVSFLKGKKVHFAKMSVWFNENGELLKPQESKLSEVKFFVREPTKKQKESKHDLMCLYRRCSKSREWKPLAFWRKNAESTEWRWRARDARWWLQALVNIRKRMIPAKREAEQERKAEQCASGKDQIPQANVDDQLLTGTSPNWRRAQVKTKARDNVQMKQVSKMITDAKAAKQKRIAEKLLKYQELVMSQLQKAKECAFQKKNPEHLKKYLAKLGNYSAGNADFVKFVKELAEKNAKLVQDATNFQKARSEWENALLSEGNYFSWDRCAQITKLAEFERFQETYEARCGIETYEEAKDLLNELCAVHVPDSISAKSWRRDALNELKNKMQELRSKKQKQEGSEN